MRLLKEGAKELYKSQEEERFRSTNPNFSAKETLQIKFAEKAIRDQGMALLEKYGTRKQSDGPRDMNMLQRVMYSLKTAGTRINGLPLSDYFGTTSISQTFSVGYKNSTEDVGVVIKCNTTDPKKATEFEIEVDGIEDSFYYFKGTDEYLIGHKKPTLRGLREYWEVLKLVKVGIENPTLPQKA